MSHLVRRALHPLGMQPLALLDVHGLAGLSRRDEEIGLPAQKRRNLQHVRDLGDDGALRGVVNVGQDPETASGSHACEGRQTGGNAGATMRPVIRPVGLVETRLENDSPGYALRQPNQRVGHLQVQAVVFKHARAGNHEELVARKKRSAHGVSPRRPRYQAPACPLEPCGGAPPPKQTRMRQTADEAASDGS